jgi:hypothetical protein
MLSLIKSLGFSIAALRFADHEKLPDAAPSPGMTMRVR